MKRSIPAVVAALLALAPASLAAQHAPARHPHRHPHRHLGHDPRPHVATVPSRAPRPGTPDGRLVDAPTPDLQIAVPAERPAPAVAVRPEILQEHVVPTGQGYTYGSTPEAIQNSNTAKAPGVGMTVPIR